MRLLKLIPDNTNIGFVRIRYIAFAVTMLLTIFAIGLVAIRGLNMGVDFAGGVSIEEKFVTAPPLDQVRSTVNGLGFGESALQQLGGANTVTIRLPLPDSTAPDAVDKMVEAAKSALATKFPGATFSNYSTVSGKVSGELIQNGVLAVVLAIVGIAIFSWFRYEWQFGVSTAVAILHDVLMTLGFFAAFREFFTFDLNIVAAVLTIIGYSINDKMVIDDRIRENMRKYRKMEVIPLLNLSLNETLSRTIVTSLSIMLALLVLLLLGPEVIFGLTIAILIGIFVGTYSSIYISVPMLVWLKVGPDSFVSKPQSAGERVTSRNEGF